MNRIEAIPLQDFPKKFADSLVRKGLLDKIENSPAGSVLVCSMAGYGKSTLLSQLAARAQHAVVCILGHSDNDLPFFLRHLSEAIHRSVPQLKIKNEDHTDTLLLRICRLALENRMTLIFDNCQVVTDGEVCKALQFLISAAENGFKVVMGSRKTPDFVARFILEERCQLLRRDELALSEREVGELVSMHLNADDPQLAKYLHSFTGGWAAGVIFCLRSGKFFAKEPPAWEDIVDRDLIKKYIAFEILPNLPPGVVRFAQRASIFDSLSVDLCDTILEASNSRECLNFLAENDIFLRECPGKQKSFIWIDIFQKAMLDLLAAAEKTVIVEKTVEYYLKHKMPLKAISFALKYKKPDLI
ncbi:MAG: hypothetical protein GX244_00570, partial [Firmicutes bacterium]|nr:hypothetical protein [Bacillota bacterium]